MLNSRQKKQYLILVIFAIGWRLIGSPLWYRLAYFLMGVIEDTVIGQGMFAMLFLNMFPRFIEQFGFYVLAVGSTCIAIRSEEKQKKFIYALSLALIALWAAVPFFEYFTIKDMSLWNLNMKRSNFVPFHGSIASFLTSIFFTIQTDGDSWLNIGLFIPLSILAAGCKKRWKAVLLCIGAGCAIEIMQFCTSIGHLDVNDMVYRAIGTFIGLGIGVLVLRRKKVRSIREKNLC